MYYVNLGNKNKPLGLVVYAITLDATNKEIQEFMEDAKRKREQIKGVRITLTIGEFDDDKRELWEIPEVRGLCRRIVNLGLISYLDRSTMLPTTPEPELVSATWGAFEVWLCASGKMKEQLNLTFKESLAVLAEFRGELDIANAKCDALLGPLRLKE